MNWVRVKEENDIVGVVVEQCIEEKWVEIEYYNVMYKCISRDRWGLDEVEPVKHEGDS